MRGHAPARSQSAGRGGERRRAGRRPARAPHALFRAAGEPSRRLGWALRRSARRRGGARAHERDARGVRRRAVTLGASARAIRIHPPASSSGEDGGGSGVHARQASARAPAPSHASGVAENARALAPCCAGARRWQRSAAAERARSSANAWRDGHASLQAMLPRPHASSRGRDGRRRSGHALPACAFGPLLALPAMCAERMEARRVRQAHRASRARLPRVPQHDARAGGGWAGGRKVTPGRRTPSLPRPALLHPAAPRLAADRLGASRTQPQCALPPHPHPGACGACAGIHSSRAEYRLVAKKGEGTFSEVLKAQCIKNGKYVAIKCMKNHFDSLEVRGAVWGSPKSADATRTRRGALDVLHAAACSRAPSAVGTSDAQCATCPATLTPPPLPPSQRCQCMVC